MTVTTTRISADEFLAGDYPIGSELIDGVVHVERSDILCTSGSASGSSGLSTGGPRLMVGGAKRGWGGNWVLSDGHVYKPDVWWAAEPPGGTRRDGPPDLAVAVRSPGTWFLDVGAKREEYVRSGTRELWLVDTPARTVLVYRAGGSLELGPGEQLTGPLLPGFTLAIDDLFAG